MLSGLAKRPDDDNHFRQTDQPRRDYGTEEVRLEMVSVGTRQMTQSAEAAPHPWMWRSGPRGVEWADGFPNEEANRNVLEREFFLICIIVRKWHWHSNTTTGRIQALSRRPTPLGCIFLSGPHESSTPMRRISNERWMMKQVVGVCLLGWRREGGTYSQDAAETDPCNALLKTHRQALLQHAWVGGATSSVLPQRCTDQAHEASSSQTQPPRKA